VCPANLVSFATLFQRPTADPRAFSALSLLRDAGLHNFAEILH
jgi:hypothetical protein